jgi:hypothetical protein
MPDRSVGFLPVSGIWYHHDQCCELEKPEFIPSSSLETNIAVSVIKISKSMARS